MNIFIRDITMNEVSVHCVFGKTVSQQLTGNCDNYKERYKRFRNLPCYIIC